VSAVTAQIDGREIEVREAETILGAARRLGIDVPALCHVDGLEPEGACRLCSVEVEGAPHPRAACHTTLAPGAVVRTETPALAALRRDILMLYVESRPGVDARVADRSFGRLLARYDVPVNRSSARAGRIDTSHPYLRFDPSLCITCRRCVRTCDEIQGQFVYAVGSRGGETRLLLGATDRFADSPCTACGACVDRCPTGALSDVDREDRTLPDRVTQSVCGYCGVGCRIEVESHADSVLRIRGVADAAVNRGHLCAKGRYAHAWHRSGDRVVEPLRRRGSDFEPIGWEAALAWLAQRLTEVRERHGPRALGGLSSSRSTNEAAYLLQKLFRSLLGTNNIDCCARVCHSSTALALQRVTGTGAASASYADIERAGCIVVAGANPTEAHPVVGARIKQAALRGTPLVVIDPRKIELVDYAELHLALRPGTNVPVFNAIAKILLDEGLVDRPYVDARVEGLPELSDLAADLDVSAVATTAGIEPALLLAAARRIGGTPPVLFVSGLGLSELTQGTASVMALANLGMLTGAIGRPGGGMLPLRGQNNVQGNADMGSMPGQLTGYQALDDPAARGRVERLWGVAAPEWPGLTLPEMFDAAVRGDLRALWIQGEDVAQSDPNERHVLDALRALDFLVVQEMFLTETARHADLVLPAAGYLEQEGTFTNAERRIQHVRPAVAAPGSARPDWEVVRDAAVALGAHWRYDAPAQVMDEIAQIAPDLFGGVRYDRLAPDGLQWPCPTLDHPGTATVHGDGFLRGRGRLSALAYQPSPEHDVAGFPYLLVTGRVLQQYNVGSMTRRTAHRELAPDDPLEIHPDDARRERVGDGDLLELESRWGATRVRARVSPRVAPGTLFLSFHYPQTHANRVTGPSVDPDSKCPQYKATAVRLRRGAADPQPTGLDLRR
jgi:formate dehydrogenase major subunit